MADATTAARARIDSALAELAFHAKELRMLGTYRQARGRG